MSNSIEIFLIIVIIAAQATITWKAWTQIKSMKKFLPGGRASLELKDYEIPVDKILELEPSQVVDKITYRKVEKVEDPVQNEPVMGIPIVEEDDDEYSFINQL